MRLKDYIRSLQYIYWRREAEKVLCTHSQFNSKLKKLREVGYQIDYTTIRDKYKDNYYSIKYLGKHKNVFAYIDGKYYIYYTNTVDDTKNEHEEKLGEKAIKMLNKWFLKDNMIGLKRAFGYTEEKFKRCIPKNFSYYNESYNKPLITSGVDFSSAWPASAQGRLPDAHDMKEYDGTVAPNEEYPFAFYINSGHVAEYGVFDTHDWLISKLSDGMFRDGKDKKDKYPQNQWLKPEEDKTILMKASKYELGKYYKKFYDMRHDNPDAKLYANASLGYMHLYNYKQCMLAHIVAIVLARAQQKTFEVLQEVGEMNVIHAVVDGVVYKGSYQIGEDTKYFGCLHQEWVGKMSRFRKTNQYIIMNSDGTCFKVIHGGYSCHKDGSPINEDTVKSLKDFDNWVVKEELE